VHPARATCSNSIRSHVVGSCLSRISFVGCYFSPIDFIGCYLNRINFIGCYLNRINFIGCYMSRIIRGVLIQGHLLIVIFLKELCYNQVVTPLL
jgi:hypothetical protein